MPVFRKARGRRHSKLQPDGQTIRHPTQTMRVTTAIFGALAAAAAAPVVAADDIRLNNIHKRIEPTKIIRMLEARCTPECTSAIYAFIDAVTGSDPIPTPPPALESWAA
ncbi:hypothetical protein CTA1_4388 [Colletotrichum tanaceti]|uniref:Uncharacterized protein n=1 Tax=Colletotrichum tanaceti TaxID=1306861 RepID=A0A4U6X8L2_9PEZI|nr:hypothetical protein CTA1_4388 [Colletotrichum tanaceti]